MNLLIKSVLVFLLLLPVKGFTQDQSEPSVEISKEKAVINGKSYYLHTVKKGETIYKISKAYNVTQKDIVLANPEAISGTIKDGQIIKIPTESGSPKNIQQIESENFIYHIVEEKQTLFYLTQKYKISEKELFKYNPELEFSPLQVGQIVKIPKSPNVPVGTEKFNPAQKLVEYKVGRGETKYSISKKYNISVDDLIAANPILNTQDLQKGQVLQIPVKDSSRIVSVPVISPDSVQVIYDNQARKSMPCDNYKPFSETYNVALLLPVNLDEFQTPAVVDSANQKANVQTTESYQIAVNLMEFYQGALLAVDSLKKSGLSLNLHVYDTGKDNSLLAGILLKPEMKKMDLIIGPLTKVASAVEKTAQFAQSNKIKMVSPVFSEDKVVANNPYVFQISPSEDANADHMVKYISALGDKNIILVHSSDARDKAFYDLYKSKIEKTFPGKFKTFNYSSSTSRNIRLLLNSAAPNIVIIPSEQPAIIQNLLNILNYSAQKDSIRVAGLSSWTVLKGIEQEYLHNVEFMYSSAFFIDFNNPSVKNFLSKYYNFYKSEPYFHMKDISAPHFCTREGYNFAFLGYDLTFYFLTSLGTMGKNFEDCIGHRKIDLLHTNIIFQRMNPQSGFLNNGVSTIRYTKDFSMILEDHL